MLKKQRRKQKQLLCNFFKKKELSPCIWKSAFVKMKMLKKKSSSTTKEVLLQQKKSNVESFFVLTASSFLLTLMVLVLVATSKRGFRAHKKTMRKWALFEKETNAFFFVAKQKKTLWSSLFVNKVVFSLFFWQKTEKFRFIRKKQDLCWTLFCSNTKDELA